MTLFYLHAGLMAAGFLLFFAALLTAATQRQRRGWLKAHRSLGLTGTTALIAGAVAAFLLVLPSGDHFQMPHAWLGGLTILLALATPSLGWIQFKIPKRAALLRPLHRAGGRLLCLAALVTILMGLRLAGLL